MVVTHVVLDIAVFSVLGLLLISFIRVVIGPSTEDRMIGLNMVSGNIVALLVLLSVQKSNTVYLDVALVYAILGYIGTLLLARRWKN